MIKGMHAMYYSSQVAELKQRWVEFSRAVEDHGYGFVTFFRVPGDFQIQLYQPKYVKS